MTVSGQDINTNVVLTSDVSGYTTAMRQAAGETQEAQSAVDKLSSSLDKIRQQTRTGLKIFAAADLAALTAATKAAADFDTQMGALRANAAVTGQEFSHTARTITDLRRELPMATREVTGLVESMTKMGASQTHMREQVETVKRLSEATNESAIGLADGLVSLQRQMGAPNEGFTKLSDNVMALSANMGVSANSILGFAQNIAPVARTVGMTSQEVLGFSSAFVKSGQDGFLAANVMSSMMMNISRASRYGTQDLAMYANAAGMTVDSFKELSASDQFLKIVQELNRSGPDAIRMLDRMGIDGARSARAIQGLTQSGELGKAMEIAGADNTGATLEASEEAMNGLNESTTRLVSSLQMLGETLGGPLADVASKFVDLLTSMVQVADKAVTPISAIAGPTMALVGAGAGVLGSTSSVLGPLLTASAAMTMWNGPMRGGFEYARRGNTTEGMSPRLATGVQSTLDGRAGPLQRGMFSAGTAAGAMFGGMFGRRGEGGEGPQERSFRTAASKFFANNPKMGESMDNLSKSWKDTTKTFTTGSGGGNRVGLGTRFAWMAAGAAGGAARFTEMGLDGLTKNDYTDRSAKNSGRIFVDKPFTTARTGTTTDGGAATMGGAARNAARSITSLGASAVRATSSLTAMGASALSRGVGAVGRGLSSIGLSPQFLAAGGVVAGGAWLYNQHKEQKAWEEGFTSNELDTALNTYAAHFGTAGEAALSFANAANDAKEILTGENTGEISDSDVQRVLRGDYTPKDTKFEGMDAQQATERVMSTFSTPGVEVESRGAARDDLLFYYGREGAQEIINNASTFNPIMAIENYENQDGFWTPSWHQSKATRERLQHVRDISTSARNQALDLYGADSEIYKDTVTAQAVELITQIGTANDDDARALIEILNEVTGFDLDKKDDAFWNLQGDSLGAAGTAGDARGAIRTREESLEEYKKLLAEFDETEERLRYVETRGLRDSSFDASENDPKELERMKNSRHGYLWTGENAELYRNVTFGSESGDPESRARAATNLIEDIARTLHDPDMSSQFTPSDIIRQLTNEMGIDPSSPVFQLYDEGIAEAGRRQQWQSATSDQFMQYTAIINDYENAQKAYRDNPDTPGAVERARAAEDTYMTQGRGGLYNTLLSWKRANEDMEFQEAQASENRTRDLAWQSEDYERQRSYTYEDYYRSVARANEDFARSRQRSEEDFNQSRNWTLEDYYLSLNRQEDDYQLSRVRGEYDYRLSRQYALDDYNKSRRRQEEDFNHQQVLMARQTARNLTDIYSRMNVQRTWDAENLLVNSQEQIDKMARHRSGLDSLRDMGVSSDAIKLMNLNDFSMVDQVTRLVSDFTRDPTLIRQLNAQIAERMRYGMASMTDPDNESYAESQRQYELSRKRTEEDFNLSRKRQEEAYNLSIDRMEEDYRKSLSRSNDDFRKSMDRNDTNFKKSMTRQNEDYSLSMSRQGDDFARTMERNEEQWARSLARNNEVWETQLRQSREALNHSFRITTGDFTSLADFAMETMSGVTQGQVATLAKGLGVQSKEVEKVATTLAKEMPDWLAPLFGGKENFQKAISGGAFGDLFNKKPRGDVGGRHLNHVGGPDGGLEPADLGSYRKVLDSAPASPAVSSGGAAHPLAGQSFRVSSGYGVRRQGYTHNGIDFAAAGGTPVGAYSGGIVKSAAYSAQSGNVVAIDHLNGYETRYHHLKHMDVRAGDVVTAGQKIGGVGTTGWNSTGNHLHFSVYMNGRTIDPTPFVNGTQFFPGQRGQGKGGGIANNASDVEKFLYALRMVESSNNYSARSPISTASGAYQYINSTWNNYGGYSRAYLAPASVQDERARRDVMAQFNRYGNWEQVAAHHLYPAWASDRGKWNNRPGRGNPTVAQYVSKVMGYMGGGGFIGGSGGPMLSYMSPSTAQVFQAIVQAQGMQDLEDTLAEGTLATAIPRGRTSMGLASIYAGEYDKGRSDGSLEATEWFAEGGIVNKHTQAILGERGPELVMPLDDVGVDFLASLMKRLNTDTTWANSMPGGGSQTIVNNYYQQIDQGNHMHGAVTVVANDTNAMYRGLEREARRERLMSR